jgi:hypothetical protein
MPRTIILLLILFVLCIICVDSTVTVSVRKDLPQPSTNDQDLEHMAPIDYATFKNKTPYGRCSQGNMKRTDCEVGNCPLGTTVSDQTFCEIQCAQEPDPKLKAQCYNHCMDMMPNCH